MGTPKKIDHLEPKQRLWFWSVAHADFLQSKIAADSAVQLRETGDNEMCIMAGEVAVIRFARPFCRCLVPQDRAPNAPPPPQLSTMLTPDYVPSNVKGGKSIIEGALRSRNAITAHSDIEYKPVRLTKTSPAPGLFRWKLAALRSDFGEYNLRQISRVADALARKTGQDVSDLANQLLWQYVNVGDVATIEFMRDGKRRTHP